MEVIGERLGGVMVVVMMVMVVVMVMSWPGCWLHTKGMVMSMRATDCLVF